MNMKAKRFSAVRMLIATTFFAGAAVMTSCGTSTQVATLADINGEWLITEAGGKAVSASQDEERPFIGFDSNEGRIYGYMGCNRLTGTFNKNMKPGKIDMSKTGSTRMMCPDMTTEDLIMSQMSKISNYKKLKGNKIALTDDKDNNVIILERKIK